MLGPEGEHIGKSTIQAPKCAACQYGKQQCNPKLGSQIVRDKDTEGALKKDKLEPGALIFSDQYESRLPGHVFNARGSGVHTQTYMGGTLFCDAASGCVSVHNQVSLGASDMIASKIKFEHNAMSTGVTVQDYCTDNGVYSSKEFMDELAERAQSIQMSGVGAHHQNGVAENAI